MTYTGPQRGKFGSSRDSADSILKAVEKGEAIQLDTLKELLELLGQKTDYSFHIAVEVSNPRSALLKTIDNERDARETIRRLKEKKEQPQPHIVDHAYLSAGDVPGVDGDRAYTGCFTCGRPRSQHAS